MLFGLSVSALDDLLFTRSRSAGVLLFKPIQLLLGRGVLAMALVVVGTFEMDLV